MYLGEVWVFIDDGLEQFHPVFVSEWGESCDHLVDEASQTPPVDIDLVSHLLDDLWGQVFGGAADGGGCLVLAEDLGQAEVSQLDVAVLVDDDVFGFQTRSEFNLLSVDDLVAVECFEGQDDLGGIELSSV